jgi:U-box domain
MTVSTESSSYTSASRASCLSDEEIILDIPQEFICPITHDIMKYPLMSRYGQTYDRDAILTWLSQHNNLCPLTRKVLHVNDLIRHRALQSQIEAWQRHHHGLSNDDEKEAPIHHRDDYEEPYILLTCRRSDLVLSDKSDHNSSPKKEMVREGEHCLLRHRLLRIIRSS